MSRNRPNERHHQDDGHPDLHAKQELAIEHLAAGLNPTDVASQVGISREQLWRWRTQNATFANRLAQRKVEIHQALADRLWRISGKALAVAEECLDEGDPRMAIEILRLVARGLTDVDLARTGDAEDSVSPDFRCTDCGLRAKSLRGLVQHRRAKHKRPRTDS